MFLSAALLLALGSNGATPGMPPTVQAFPECKGAHGDTSLEEAAASAKSWWQGPLTAHDVEQSNLSDNHQGKPVPFGAFNSQWREFKGAIRTGDKIYSATYANGIFLHTYVLIRHGCIVRYGPLTALS